MASLYITEFALIGETSRGKVQTPEWPAVAHQKLTIGAETDSAAFNAATKFIRVHADAICSIVITASAPAATTSMCRMAAGQTEYFSVKPGHYLSVITNT